MPISIIESIEPRLLLAVDLVGSQLVITGSGGADTFEFANRSDSVRIVSSLSGVAQPDQIFSLADFSEVSIRTDSGPDLIILGSFQMPAFIDGGKGNDTISSGGGADKLYGGGGNDYIFGSDGRDFLDGQAGGDDMLGGGGKDILDYSYRTADLFIGRGVLADDGEAGEQDNVRTDIELILGGSGNDTISSNSSRPIEIYGFDGNDTLAGGSGDDVLRGGDGVDNLQGVGGIDTFFAEDGFIDVIDGGSGDDVIGSADPDDVLSNI